VTTLKDKARLQQLALTLGLRKPDYAVRSGWTSLRVRLSTEDATVLAALAAEAGISPENAAYRILRATIGVEPRLVREVFFGDDASPSG